MSSPADLSNGERRFRASIYIDVWVPRTADLEEDRDEATRIARDFASLRANTFIGGIALVTGDLSQPLDRII